MKIGLFPGSFNPVHIGHLAIANHVAEFEGLDEVWFLVTPQNPIKKRAEIIPQELRLELVEKAIGNYSKFKVNTLEWTLPKPTYTVTTLQKLKMSYPEHQFFLIIGTDNWEVFHRWKDYQRILNNFKIIIYPRMGSNKVSVNHINAYKCKAPLIDISSTFIRKSIINQKDVRFFMPEGAYERLMEEKVFEKSDNEFLNESLAGFEHDLEQSN